ncbi:hypothetical protein PTKIN_Ptkin12aG0042100 [Pterospermum kingtungense]
MPIEICSLVARYWYLALLVAGYFLDNDKRHIHMLEVLEIKVSHYDDFATIFGEDRAIGAASKSAIDFVDATDFDNAPNNDLDADDFEDATNIDLDGIENVSTGATSRRCGSTERTKSDDEANELIQYLDSF